MIMSIELCLATIKIYCKQLGLTAIPTILTESLKQPLGEPQRNDEFLKYLLEHEINKRNERALERRLREARFEDVKTLDQLNWDFVKGATKSKINALAQSDFVTQNEDVIILGPVGTGKTHIAKAIGLEAVKKGFKVLFIRASELVRTLVEAKEERQLGQLYKKYRNINLLIIDELGFVPFKKEESELLFNLLSERYEKFSTIITSNLSFEEWVDVFGNEKLTSALLDRLVHHVHILTMKGKSFRLNCHAGLEKAS